MLCRRWDDGQQLAHWSEHQWQAGMKDKTRHWLQAGTAERQGSVENPFLSPCAPVRPQSPEGLCGRHSPHTELQAEEPHLVLRAPPDWLSISPAISGLLVRVFI